MDLHILVPIFAAAGRTWASSRNEKSGAGLRQDQG
jgi:hypothetical protein